VMRVGRHEVGDGALRNVEVHGLARERPLALFPRLVLDKPVSLPIILPNDR
jgi:hypothetical protein